MVHLGYLSLPMNRLACGAFCTYVSLLCFGALFVPGVVVRSVPVVEDILSTSFGMMNFIVGAYLLCVGIYNMCVKLPATSHGSQLRWKEEKKPDLGLNVLKKLGRLLLNPPDVYIISFALIFHVGVISICYHAAVQVYQDSPPAEGILYIITAGSLILWLSAIFHEEKQQSCLFETKVTWNTFLFEAFDVLSQRGVANIIILLNATILLPLTGYSCLRPLAGNKSAYVKYLNLSEHFENLTEAFLLLVMAFAAWSSYCVVKEGFIAASESLRKRILLKERYDMTVLAVLFRKKNMYQEKVSNVIRDYNSLMFQQEIPKFEKDLIDYFTIEEAEKPFPVIAAKWNPDVFKWIPQHMPDETDKTTQLGAGTSIKDSEVPPSQPETKLSGQGAEESATDPSGERSGITESTADPSAENLEGITKSTAGISREETKESTDSAAERAEVAAESIFDAAAETSEEVTTESISDAAAERSGGATTESDVATERSEAITTESTSDIEAERSGDELVQETLDTSIEEFQYELRSRTKKSEAEEIETTSRQGTPQSLPRRASTRSMLTRSQSSSRN